MKKIFCKLLEIVNRKFKNKYNKKNTVKEDIILSTIMIFLALVLTPWVISYLFLGFSNMLLWFYIYFIFTLIFIIIKYYYIDLNMDLLKYIKIKYLKYIIYTISVISILIWNIYQFASLLKYNKFKSFSFSESFTVSILYYVFTSLFVISFLLTYMYLYNYYITIQTKKKYNKKYVNMPNQLLSIFLIFTLWILYFYKKEINFTLLLFIIPVLLWIGMWMIWNHFTLILTKDFQVYIYKWYEKYINIIKTCIILIGIPLSIWFLYGCYFVVNTYYNRYFTENLYFIDNNLSKNKIYKMCYMNDNYVIYSSTSGSSNCNTGDVYVKKITDDMIFCDNKNLCQNNNNENTTWNKVSTQKKEKQ